MTCHFHYAGVLAAMELMPKICFHIDNWIVVYQDYTTLIITHLASSVSHLKRLSKIFE